MSITNLFLHIYDDVSAVNICGHSLSTLIFGNNFQIFVTISKKRFNYLFELFHKETNNKSRNMFMIIVNISGLMTLSELANIAP
jgi:hypothetical protein